MSGCVGNNFQYNCGCVGPTGSVQAKAIFASVYLSHECFDISDAVSWIEENFDATIPWAVQPNGFYQFVNAAFGATTDTSPDALYPGSETWSEGEGDQDIASEWELGGSDGGPDPDYYGLPGKSALLIPGETAVLQGTWCNSSGGVVTENCLMNGTPTTVSDTFLGNLYDIPIPPAGLCLSGVSCGVAGSPTASYAIIPLTNYSGFFIEIWTGTLPSACMASGDPFFGDDPP